MFLGHEKKNWYRALLSPQKWKKVHFLAFFLRKEGPNQKIALRKKVLEFNFIADRTLKKWKCWIFWKNLKYLAKCRKFWKFWILNFFRVLLAIKLNSKTNLHSAIFWFRPSFLKKMPKNALFSTFGGLKVPGTNFFFHAPKTYIFCQLKLFSKNFLVEEFQSYRVQLFSSYNPWH